MPSPQIQFRALPPLDRHLSDRTEENASETARRDLTRYYAALEQELSRLTLSEPEASLLVDVLNGHAATEGAFGWLAAEVEDGIRLDGLAEKWGLENPAVFVARLQALTATQELALLDAAERFWRTEGVEDTRKRLRIVGLIR